ncbi:7tm chemosensory receptor domain-containing protein [Phthorimaea operculella]|nr:7tm chemosensory receptor domain-containing protein [Phthorimaea operculella]
MVLTSFLMLYYKVTIVYPRQSRVVSMPDVLQILNDDLQFIIDLYYISKYDKSAYTEYYRKYALIDSFLNRQPDPEVNRRLTQLIGIFTLIWFINFALQFSALWYEHYWQYALIFVPYHFFVLCKMLTILFLSAHTLRIERRLQMLGDSVEDCYSLDLDGSWENINALKECRKLTARIRKPSEIEKPGKPLWFYQQKKVAGLSKFYLILTEQCEFVNKMFGIRILLLSLNLTIDMVRFINSIYRYISGQKLRLTTYFLAAASVSRTLTCMAMLFTLVHHCERAYRQADRIVRRCDRVLITGGKDDEVQAAVSELRELVLSRPVSFTVANFFRLEYPALTAMAATVVSYSIILFQSM